MTSAGTNMTSRNAHTLNILINVVCFGIIPGGVGNMASEAKLTMAAHKPNTIADRLYGHFICGGFTVPMEGSYMKL